jgi:HK97 family phage major capsid protein
MARNATHRIPYDVLASGFNRDLVVGTATAGGNLVATELKSDSFIDMLINSMALQQMGITTLTDLNGNIAIPRQTGGATGFWVAESGATTESDLTFDQVLLSPKTVAAMTDVSRQLLLQSSLSVEQLLRRDLAMRIALEMDRAGIHGSGTANQPRGLLNTSGIGSVAGGANGLAPTWDNIVGLETLVDNANGAIGNLGYLTNSRVRGRLKRTQRFSSTDGAAIWEAGDEMNGYKAAVSNQVPSNLTKGTSTGVCSAIMFGNWSDLLMGLWGGLDILVNPFIGSGTGTVRIEVYQSADINVRQPGSFAAMADALTV